MKEAAGEANLTVVTIILIAAVVAIITPIVTSMMQTTGQKTCCMNSGGYWKTNKCFNANDNKEIAVAKYWDVTNKVCIEGTNN